MKSFSLLCLPLICLLLPSSARAAKDWDEVKISGQPFVTFESFCAFYRFEPVAIPEKDPFEIEGPYGKLSLTANSRDLYFNGRRVWLSFPFIRNEEGKGYLAKLDIIKLFDPLLRKAEIDERSPVEGVVIDPGHGGEDNGTGRRSKIYEKEANLDTARRLARMLKEAGIPYIMTRNSDTFVELSDRARIANRKPGWIFVSLHFNSGPSHAHGVETYSLTPQYAGSTDAAGRVKAKDRIAEAGNKNDFENFVLSDFIHQEIIKRHSKAGDRGLKRARFVVLRECKIPGVLLEGGFLSNEVDANLIMSESYREKVALAVFNGIKNYMAFMQSPVQPEPLILAPSDKTKPSPDVEKKKPVKPTPEKEKEKSEEKPQPKTEPGSVAPVEKTPEPAPSTHEAKVDTRTEEAPPAESPVKVSTELVERIVSEEKAEDTESPAAEGQGSDTLPRLREAPELEPRKEDPSH